MLDKLFRKKISAKEPSQESTSSVEEQAHTNEEMLDETGTFMLDISQIKETEDLEDLLKDI